MHPIICTFGPFTIYSYGLMLVIAFMVSSTLACRQARKAGIPDDALFNILFAVFISGIVGARLLFILQNAGYYIQNPREIIMVQHGGLSWFGGLIVASVVGIAYVQKKRLILSKVLDVVVPFVALGQSIGRIGCLLNGCCYGKVSQYGLYFSVHDAVLIPTQLYSSLIMLAVYVALRFLQERPHQQGSLFCIYILLYTTKRFFIEFWRADNPAIFHGLTLFQVMSVILFCGALAALFFMRTLRRGLS